MTGKFLLTGVIATCLLAGGLTIGGVAKADTLADIRAAGVIRVATDLGNPPFGFKNDELKKVGYDVDTARLLAHDLGVELKIVPITQANRIPYLITGKADIVISTLAITPKRQKVIDFSTPYAAILNVVGAPKTMQITTPADLAGHKIAVTRGTTNDASLTDIAPPATRIVRFGDEATTLTAVTSGRAKLIADNPYVLKLLNKKAPSLGLVSKITLKQIKLGIGVRKGNDHLKQWLNKWISANLKNGKLNAFYKKYTSADLPKEITGED